MLSKKLIKKSNILIPTFFLIVFGLAFNLQVNAQNSESDIRNQIMDITTEIDRIEKEIARYSSLYNATSKEAKSLQNALNQLEINRKKLVSELSLTENKIKKTTLSIEDLSSEIRNTESAIVKNSNALSDSIIYLNRLESDTTVEIFFKYNTLSEALDYLTNIERFQKKVNSEIIIAKDLRTELVSKRNDIEEQKRELVNYKDNLSDQKAVVEYSKRTQDNLLSVTKNKEAEYQKLLAERQRQKDAFEKELFSYESELRLIIDPASIPGAKSGILSWPLANIFVTQYFGRTIDSRRLYTSGTHNGVDFRAAIGTPVKTALSGVIWSTGNTDLASGCYSYGKWVLVKHPNGLSTLYAHLSQISVSQGQAVVTGDVIGYSGNTGYSTGPHLHFGVYATQGVQVQKYSSSKFCQSVVIPLADIKAYLDPMAYLPKL